MTTAVGKTLRSGSVETARQPRPGPIADSLPDERSPAGAGLEAELAELERLSLEDLRLRWRNHWGRLAPAPISRNLLLRLMAYRLQAEAFGDLDRETVRILERLAQAAPDKSASDRSSSPASDGASAATLPIRKAANPLILRPGALLVREWQGRLEHVMVVHDGFAWNGATYSSLSAVAFAITGTKWSGHQFFGVRHQDRVPNRRSGDRGQQNRSENSSALSRGDVDDRPLAPNGSTFFLLGAIPDPAESVQ